MSILHRGFAIAAVPALLSLVGACGQESARPAQVATTPPVAASSDAADSGALDPLDEKLRHCPLTVPGVVAELRDIEGGIEVDLRVPSDDAMPELRRRVRHLEEFTSKHGKGTGERHNTGKGGGWMRDCPVVTRDTTVKGAEIERGFRVVVHAVEPAATDTLRQETRRRMAALAERH